MSISAIRKNDQRLSSAAGVAPRVVAAELKNTPAEKTAAVMAELVIALVNLKNGILVTAEADNLYATNVLFRVFLEHALKAMTIFMRAVHDHSDVFAESYLRLVVPEARQYLSAIQESKLEPGAEIHSVLAPWFAEAGGLTRSQAKAMEEPFKYKSMIRTLNDYLGESGANFLTKIIPNYSELSGFVHGGPSAAMVMKAFENVELRRENLRQVADLTVSMTYSVTRYLLELAATIRPQVKLALERLDAALSSDQ